MAKRIYGLRSDDTCNDLSLVLPVMLYIFPVYIFLALSSFFAGYFVAKYYGGQRQFWLFISPITIVVIFLALYDYTVLSWYVSGSVETRFWIRVFVQPMYYSWLVLLGNWCGMRFGPFD